MVSGAILGLFFFGFGYLWNPVYEAERDHEEAAWLGLTSGIGSGNAIYTTFVGFFVAMRDKLKLSSLVSAAAQISIHSVVATQKYYYITQILALNFSAVLNSNLIFTSFDNVALPVLEDVGFGVLAGQDKNLSEVSFLLNGILCSGQLIPHASFETECFVDRTTCEHTNYLMEYNSVTNEPRYIYPYPDYDKTYSFRNNFELAFTNMAVVDSDKYFIIERSSNEWSTDGAEYFGEFNITNVKMTFKYSGVLPLDNITSWRVYGPNSIEPAPDSNKNYTVPTRVYTDNESTDYWRGQCNMRIELCRAMISDSQNVTTLACNPAIFKTNYVNADHETVVGIGEVWRTDNTFSNVISTLAETYPELLTSDPTGQKVIEKAIGVMGLAWATTQLQLDANSRLLAMDGNPVSDNVRLRNITGFVITSDPMEAIALDAVLSFTLLVFLTLSLVIFGLGFGTAMCGSDEVIWLNKMAWDPLFKYSLLVNEEEKKKRKIKIHPLKDSHGDDSGRKRSLMRFPKPLDYNDKLKKRVGPSS
ncbi:hypothetical protein HDU97_001663 [Phlyctochytrium planicorne]|nr:hypothetical protein HDU97_001663 [Phlyctochytrium planicorne]